MRRWEGGAERSGRRKNVARRSPVGPTAWGAQNRAGRGCRTPTRAGQSAHASPKFPLVRTVPKRVTVTKIWQMASVLLMPSFRGFSKYSPQTARFPAKFASRRAVVRPFVLPGCAIITRHRAPRAPSTEYLELEIGHDTVPLRIM